MTRRCQNEVCLLPKMERLHLPPPSVRPYQCADSWGACTRVADVHPPPFASTVHAVGVEEWIPTGTMADETSTRAHGVEAKVPTGPAVIAKGDPQEPWNFVPHDLRALIGRTDRRGNLTAGSQGPPLTGLVLVEGSAASGGAEQLSAGHENCSW